MTLAHGRSSASRRRLAPGILRGGLSLTASIALVGLGLGPTLAPVAAAAPVLQVTDGEFPTAALTPEDALAYFAFELDEESDQWLAAQQLIERAGFADALNQARDEALRDAAGNDVPLDAILGGEAAIVVTDAALEAVAGAAGTAGAAGDPADALLGGTAASPEAATADAPPAATGAALLLEARAPDTAGAAIESALQDQAAESGGSVAEVEYDGVTVRYIDGAADTDDTPLAVAQIGDIVAIAASPIDLEPIIDTSEGGAALADFGPFQDARATLADDYLLYGFVNGVAAMDAQANLGDLGIPSGLTGSATYTGILLRADDPGLRLETVSAPAEGESFPAATANYDSALATQIPGDALFFLSGGELGENGVLDTIGAALIGVAFGFGGTAATPAPDADQDAAIAAQYEQAAQLLGFNLQTDLFQQFVGEFALYVRSEADPATISALFATDVADPGTVVNALTQLNLLVQGATGGAGEATTRQVGGSEVNVVETGDSGVPDVEYGVVDDQFLLGLGTAVDDFVDGGADALADDPQFQAVMENLPNENNGMLYVDLTQVVPLLQGLAAEESAGDDGGIEDADPTCANYDDQAAAQEAYDTGEDDTFDLDQDFDGEVCEDFFAAATPEADAAAASSPVADLDLSAINAFALVAYEEGGVRRSSGLLAIDEAE